MPESSCAKAGQTQPFHSSSVPPLSLVIAWPLSAACQTRKCPGDAYGNLWQSPSSTFHLGLVVARQCVRLLQDVLKMAWSDYGQHPGCRSQQLLLCMYFFCRYLIPPTVTPETWQCVIPVHYSSSKLTWWKPAHDWGAVVKGCIQGRGTKIAASTMTTWSENMFNLIDFATPSIKVSSSLSSEKAPVRDSKVLGRQERKLLEALAEKFRTGL